jgi:hypothetical protein
MYITAHHVVAPKDGSEGLNAFLYLHGKGQWSAPPRPEEDPGELKRKLISVEPPGNRIRSYLDIVAPDPTSWGEIRQAFMQFVSESQRDPLPWARTLGQCLFRFGAEAELAKRWRTEIADLFRMTEAVRLRT